MVHARWRFHSSARDVPIIKKVMTLGLYLARPELGRKQGREHKKSRKVMLRLLDIVLLVQRVCLLPVVGD